ncbi:crotonase/enoyl-CoA hydratase family protein [Nocardia australiensis]|uniref:crotonase/enoyl-CoA hydratase family protein n=1 Tax=Nocardia australiensis TaxID=2887191 RepID=UPI001D13B8BE|nr:crotonase/enoyl-CoA hydratase family protein [Nocardia australiensis]
MSDPLLVSRVDDVVTWTLNRPQTRNVITDEDIIGAIEDAVDAVNADLSVRAVVLTGAGTTFSSGGNVKHMQQRSGMFGGSPAQIRQGYRHGVQRIPRSISACEVPTIAAVNGPAIGAGCDLALMCDLRIASTTAVFAESFVRVGLIPGDGGAWFLPRVVGLARANQMAFTGAAIDAGTAAEWGMVSEVVEPADLLARAGELAASIAVNPPHVLRMTKKLIQEGQSQSLNGHLELAASMQALAHHTADHHEAATAFVEKRPPRFTGE